MTSLSDLLRESAETYAQVPAILTDAGVMDASPKEIAALAQNIAVVATYWLNFQGIRASTTAGGDSANLALGAYQVLSLVVPFLKGEARILLQQLSLEYLT